MEEKLQFNPIGYLKSCFATKNGTPRQGSISPVSKGTLKIEKSIFNNPEHSIEGLAQFSHVWIIFVFHLNHSKSVKAKVKPPRMNGLKTGVFSTRSPHRPNPIGLTLVKLDFVENDTLHLSGLDIVDNTPVLDVKPFIPQYDFPHKFEKEHQSLCDSSEEPQFHDDDTSMQPHIVECTANEAKLTVTQHYASLDQNAILAGNNDDQRLNVKATSFCESEESEFMKPKNHCTEIASWLKQPPIPELHVLFSNRALSSIAKFHSCPTTGPIEEHNSHWKLEKLKPEDLKQAILEVLEADPRSSYRRKKCSDSLYYFTIDNAHITAWFDDSVLPHCVEVVRVVPKLLVNF